MKLFSNRYRAWRPLFAVVALLAAATAISAWLGDEVSLTSQAMIYLVAVVIASYAFERLSAVVCAVGAVVALNFFFVPPRFTLAVEHHEHIIALGAMLMVALLVSYLSTALRRESAAAQQSEQRATRLALLAPELAEAAGEEDTLRIGQLALEQSFGGPIFLGSATDGRLDTAIELPVPVVEALRCCMAEGAVLGPGTGRWPALDAWYVPLGAKGHVIGAARVEPAVAHDVFAREHAQAVCALVAQAIWRLRLTEANLATRADLQRQQLQSTFLAAVSHDLRTPLAAIVAAASSLSQQRGRLSEAEQDRMLHGIGAEARYLTTITENTLQLVRLASGTVAIRHEWESMEEIVGAVLGRLRAREPSLLVQIRVEDGLPFIRGDATLLAQTLTNLLDNAFKYGTPPIELGVCAVGSQLLVSVKDRGAGISIENEARLFEPFFRGRHEIGERGAGLGLALCKAIADAHGGTLGLRRRPQGGSCFTLSLPVDPKQPAKPIE